jgi:subfamily B ATP-binding cassette protein MsbA
VAERGQWRGVKRVLRFAQRHWALIALSLGATFVSTIADGAYVALMFPFAAAAKNVWHEIWHGGGQVVQNAQAIRDAIRPLKLVGLEALALAPVIGVSFFVRDYLQGRVTWQLVVDLRNALCRALMPQALSYFEGRRSGDLMSRITNDVHRAQGVFNQMFGGIPEGLSYVVMGVALAAYANWRLLIVSAVGVPLVVLPIGYLSRRIRRYGREGLEKLADLTDLMSQMFSGIRVIKAFKMEDAETQEFEYVNRRYLRKMMKMVAAQGLSVGSVEFIARGFVGLGVIVGALYFASKGATLDFDKDIVPLFVFIGGNYLAFVGVRKSIKGYTQLQESIPATDRILELLDQVPSLRDAPDAVALPRVERGIAFDRVSFGYDDEAVLRDVTFELGKGETVAVVGRSGAGKSTLVALIARFYDVGSGSVTIDGTDVRRITRESLLDRLAIVTQQTFLFNRSIADNIRYGKRDATQEEVEQAARAANIHDFVVSQPQGYDALCGEFGAKLSGGQRQRIAIARAILKNADILILDEAMAGLDAESESLVREALANLMRGRTTLVITHDLPTIRDADRILVLKDGRLVGQGTHAELMAEGGEYRSLYAFEFGGSSEAGK